MTNLNTRVKLTDAMVTALGSYSASTAYYERNIVAKPQLLDSFI